jgi:hypothetical protein
MVVKYLFSQTGAGGGGEKQGIGNREQGIGIQRSGNSGATNQGIGRRVLVWIYLEFGGISIAWI